MKILSRYRILVVGVVSLAISLSLLMWIILVNLTPDSKRGVLLYVSDPAYQLAKHTPKRIGKVIDWKTFEKWIQANVNCEADFVGDSQDEKFLKLVGALGVEGDLAVSDGPSDATWVLPKSINVFGFQANSVHFWVGSGDEFEVSVDASFEQVVEVIGARSVPLYLYKDTSYDAVIFKYKPTMEMAYPDLIFVRRVTNKISMVGCRRFDT